MTTVTEEGIVIPDGTLTKLEFKLYEPRVMEFGKQQFPLNVYAKEG